MTLHTRLRRLTAGASLGVSLLVAGCINIFWRTDPVRVPRPDAAQPVTVSSPLKAHLANGSTVIFRKGAIVGTNAVDGSGQVYPLSFATPRDTSARHVAIPFDSIVGLETFDSKVLVRHSIAVSAAATLGTAVVVPPLLVAIFGSCPTVYADTGAGQVLEAEGFSYAIAPLLEQRDLDALRVRPARDGVVRLELRNEALETHYINNIELVAVEHPRGTLAIPDQGGHPVVVDAVRPLSVARDRVGRDVRPGLAAVDGDLFASDGRTVRAAREGDLDDWIDLEARDLPPGDSVAVVLRLRNSLLNTVLLYDGILGGRDAAEYVETNLRRISTAIDLSRWYRRTLGMRVTIDGGPVISPEEPWSARLGDVGPVAFRDVAVVLPRPQHDAPVVRVRLRFVADNWRIDRAAVAGVVTRPGWQTISVARMVVSHPDSAHVFDDTAAVAAVREPDGRYLETQPGQRMTLEFTAPLRADTRTAETTYLIAWQGWYREWIRGAWLANPRRTTAWNPGNAAMLTALRSWDARRTEMERTFYATRIPVR